MIHPVGKLLLRTYDRLVDFLNHIFQILDFHSLVVLQEKDLMDRRRENVETSTKLLCRLIQKSGDSNDTGPIQGITISSQEQATIRS